MAEPGYYDTMLHQFYRWRGVRFDPAKVPLAMFGRLRAPGPLVPFRVLDIDVPPHRRALAESLNNTVAK